MAGSASFSPCHRPRKKWMPMARTSMPRGEVWSIWGMSDRAKVAMMSALLPSPETVVQLFRAQGYILEPQAATVLYLADRMSKPVLIEGPAGVGKTELAKTMAEVSGFELVRLQCYEGLDEAKALYEWEYPKQLLYTQILRDKIGEVLQGTSSLT